MPEVPQRPETEPSDEESAFEHGNLHMGHVDQIDSTKRQKYAPVKHLHPGPLGFIPTDTGR